jgi:hypothetical protein
MRSHLIWLAGLMLLAGANAAAAHPVFLEVTPKGDRYEVEAFFAGNQPAVGAEVKVLDAKEQVILNGLTDSAGRWSFRRPDAGKYTVKLDAGTGHRKEQEIDVPVASGGELDLAVVEFRRDPPPDWTWLKVAIGLAVIASLAGAYLLFSMLRNNGGEKAVQRS